MAWDLLVRRDDLNTRKVVEASDPGPLAPGSVRVQIERFSLTANNVTYGAVGDQIGYWRFFPAPDGWGRIPAWGFGEVVESTHPGVPVGERLYGYWPMSTAVDLTVGRFNDTTLTEGSPHRAELPGAYNAYSRVAAEAGYRRDWDDATAVLRPLFVTGWVLDDQLADAGFHGAEAVIATSASSKTAISMVELIHARDGRPKLIGLTSASNRAFVEALGLYDRVLAYEETSALVDLDTAVIIDFAGRSAVLADVHKILSDRLKLSLRVGVTAWDAGGGPPPEHGPAPTWFFAPDQIGRRIREWGREGYERRLADAWAAFVPSTDRWLRLTHADGAEAAERALGRLTDGSADPAEGVVVRPETPAS